MTAHSVMSVLIAIVLAWIIIGLVRRDRLHARNAAWWLLLAAMIIVVGTIPEVIGSIAGTLRISYSPFSAVLIAVVVVLLKLLRTDIQRSKDQQQIRILARKVALLEAQRGTGETNTPDSVDEKSSVQ